MCFRIVGLRKKNAIEKLAGYLTSSDVGVTLKSLKTFGETCWNEKVIKYDFRQIREYR